MRKFKSVLALLLALVLVLGCAGTAFAAKTPASELSGAKKSTDAAEAKGFQSVAFSENTYQYADDEIVRAIVVLKDAPTAALAKRGAANESTVRAQVKASQDKVRTAMRGIDYELQYSFDTLLNGFSCDVAYGDLEKIASIDGVDAVYVANHYAAPIAKKSTDTKTAWSAAMTGNDYTREEFGVDGSGIVIAVLDTGLNTTHEAFQDADGNCAATGRLTAADAALAVADGKYLNAKVPFAYDYADKDNDVTDKQGHGTHVSGIAAGCAYDEESGEYTFLGAAPGAQIVSMKIFSDAASGTSSDIYFYALEDAYRLGVDVVNMSIGAQNGFTYDDSLETEVFGNIYKRLSSSGIVLSISAGNEYSMAEYSSMQYIGPDYQDYGTVGNPSTYIGSTSVASVENYAYPTNVITVGSLSFAYTDTCEEEDKMWLNAFGDKEVEFVAVPNSTGANDKSDLGLGLPEEFKTVDVKGKIAVVQRGTLSFEEKVENAYNAGAIGCIVVNTEATMLNMGIETFEIPAICADVKAVSSFLDAANKTVATPTEKQYVPNPDGFMMSDFSGWGTTPMLTMAPAVTSVGGKVYSSVQTGDSDYDVYSGTSMAAPNFAGTVALMLQWLKENGKKAEMPTDESIEWLELSKAERAERALALLESNAQILTDADGFPYSVRKQGAGLATSYEAISTYFTSGYIADPLKELGDDPEKTGEYSFDVTLTNETENVDSNFLPSSVLLFDYVYDYYNGQREEPLLMNSLTEDVLVEGEDYTISYSIDGEPVEGLIHVEPGESCTVNVKIVLSEETKTYFDQIFPNGNYVDGFVAFDDVSATLDGKPVYADGEGNQYAYDETGAYLLTTDSDYNLIPDLGADGKKLYYTGDEDELELQAWAEVHATLLGFYGDWTKDSVLEDADFRDYLDADYFAATTIYQDGKTFAELGYSGLDFLDYYTMPNMAYLASYRGSGSLRALSFPGANALVLNDWAEPVEFMEEHMAMSTAAYTGGYNWTYELYMAPYLLRNAEHLVMTVSDKETGEVYYVDDTEYLPKSIYDEDNSAWSATGAFSWDGKDAHGDYVPSGTVAHVQYDAVLPYNETKQEAVWEFDITVDYTAPKLESIVYDKDAKTLTVTASDEQYLQGIYVGTTSDVLAAKAFSSDEKGASFTATFDVSELQKKYDYLQVIAIDYATNETEVTAPLFETGNDVKVTVVSATGTEVHEMKGGDTFVVPTAGDYDDAQFLTWCTNPVDGAATEEEALAACGTRYAAGDEILLKSDLTIYALYGVGAVEPLETTNYYYATPDDYTGEWALVGLDYVNPDFITDTPYALDGALEKKDVVADFGATVGEEYAEFYSNEKSIRWIAEKLDDGNYTFKNVVTGEYLACNADGTEIASVKEVTPLAKWNVTTNVAYGTALRSAGVEGKALIYDNDGMYNGTFEMVDNTTDWGFGYTDFPMYDSDMYPIFMYKAADEEFVISSYTTSYKEACKHDGATELRDAKEATYEEDGYTGDTYCSICGALLAKGEVIPATGYPTCYFKRFTDCKSDWYHEAVDYTVANGLMNGVAADRFDPDGTMTRAMMVTVLYRMAGSPEVKGDSTFTDVPTGQWYSDAIAWAQDNGIVLGVLTDKFAPDDFVTREQIATILWRYEGKPAVESKFDGFKDADKISDYAKEAMAWAVSEGIFNGDNGSLKPTDNATRAEFACIVMRYLGGSYACKDLVK